LKNLINGNSCYWLTNFEFINKMYNTTNKQAPVSYGIILLAAGASSRLGKPKQLLSYEGKTLLQHGIQQAVATGATPIIAVLGANADFLIKETAYHGIEVILNPQWNEGMASSIRCGIKYLQDRKPDVHAAIIMVCDQPYVTTQLLNDLVENYQATRKPIVASSYANIQGTPALFDKTIFAALLELKGDVGAKKIMKENPGMVELVNFPLGNIDIDTKEDYESLPLHLRRRY
jgi:molybdenum cofactor cytidylyltransferase